MARGPGRGVGSKGKKKRSVVAEVEAEPVELYFFCVRVERAVGVAR